MSKPQFVENDVQLSFLLLLLVSLSMTAFGFFVAAFLRKVSSGLVVFVYAARVLLRHPLAGVFARAAVAHCRRLAPVRAALQAAAAVPAGFVLFVVAWVSAASRCALLCPAALGRLTQLR